MKVNRGTQLDHIDEWGVPIPVGIEDFGKNSPIHLGNINPTIGGELPPGEVDS